MITDALILITNAVDSKYVGVWNDSGTWTQAVGHIAEALAVFDDVPDSTGTYSATIYENTDTYYEADYLFTATFAPDDELFKIE